MPDTITTTTTSDPNCSVCNKYVRSGILCDICNKWSHTKCNNLTPTDFNSLKNSDEKWFCTTCIMSIFPLNSKANLDINNNKDTSEIKELLSEMNISDDCESGDVSCVDCKYYNSEEFVNKFSNSKCLSALHLNIASLTKHFDELQTLLSMLSVNFSIIGITETKFQKNIELAINFFLQNYNVEHTATELSSGGALLYISDHLSYKPRKDLNKSMYKCKELESIFVEIIYKNKKNLIVGCIYKHPKMSTDDFNSDFLHPLLDKANKEKKSVILMGDFNINLLNCDMDKSVSNFLDIMGSYSLLPQIILPTRVTRTSKTVIDNFFFDPTNSNVISGNLTCNISDHFPQFLMVKNIFPDKKTKHNIQKHNWSKFDKNEFILDFFDTNWENCLQIEKRDIDHSFKIFFTKINNLLNKHAPLQKLSRKEVKLLNKPWITKGIDIYV